MKELCNYICRPHNCSESAANQLLNYISNQASWTYIVRITLSFFKTLIRDTIKKTQLCKNLELILGVLDVDHKSSCHLIVLASFFFCYKCGKDFFLPIATHGHSCYFIYLFLKRVRFLSQFLVWSVLCHWHMGLSSSHMQVEQVLRPRLDHVYPYTLKYEQLYMFDTYTNFVRITYECIYAIRILIKARTN